MTLDEWEKLSSKAQRFAGDETRLEMARLAAKEFLRQGFHHAEHVLIADLVRGPYLHVYVPDDTYYAFAPGWERYRESYYGFEVSIFPLRQIYVFWDLDSYQGDIYFSRRA